MTKTLRKRHLQIWGTLAILLPAGIVIAWLAVPQQPTQNLLQPANAVPLPVELKKADKQNYTVILRSSQDRKQLQLQWTNKAVLQYPTAIIYAGTTVGDFDKQKPIGRIEARGNWYFPLDASFNATASSSDHFILYDFIHQQVIDTINFTP